MISELIKQSDIILKKKNIKIDECNILENNCYICLSDINKKIEMCINMFNTLVQDISSLLSKENPNDFILKTYHGVVANIILKNPLEPISSFIINIYSNDTYRKCIINGDEKFFLNNTYDVSETNDKVQMIYQLKICWKKLSPENRQYIKNAMHMLLEITKQYIEEKDDGNNIANILEKIVIIKKR
jgi:hypothetical protein